MVHAPASIKSFRERTSAFEGNQSGSGDQWNSSKWHALRNLAKGPEGERLEWEVAVLK